MASIKFLFFVILLFLIVTSKKKKTKNKTKFERELTNLRERCKLEKCNIGSDHLISACVDYCVDKECFKETNAQVEFGETSRFRDKNFGACVKEKLRSEAKKRGEL
ncbi:unnamed protein product [Moneuplotes crassus]|uniref:Uncharacterized protein n=1 Tax=Euplotes crassus TaxID=5936 RepID=A0AAD2D9Q3_EUPCR|nr:unnamed protein product [Moneuplotes crassus]